MNRIQEKEAKGEPGLETQPSSSSRNHYSLSSIIKRKNDRDIGYLKLRNQMNRKGWRKKGASKLG